jgi:hypothetical protein
MPVVIPGMILAVPIFKINGDRYSIGNNIRFTIKFIIPKEKYRIAIKNVNLWFSFFSVNGERVK